MPQQARGGIGVPGRSQQHAYGVLEGVAVGSVYGLIMESSGGARWPGLEPMCVLDGPDSSGLSRVHWRRSRDDRRSGTLLRGPNTAHLGGQNRSTVRMIQATGVPVAGCSLHVPPKWETNPIFKVF